MIIPLHPRLTDTELRELEEIISEFGVRIQPIHGNERSIYAILGDETSQDLINRIEGLAFVERVDRIQAPYKLMSRESKLSSHRVRIGIQVPSRAISASSPATAPSIPSKRPCSWKRPSPSRKPGPT